MALLYFKRALFPKFSQYQAYATLRSSTSDDLERPRSLVRSSTPNSDFDSFANPSLSEKSTAASHLTSSLDESSRCTTSSLSHINPRIISDATLGLSDGLTVPFALTAGLSHFNSSRIVIYGGLAELLAGSISMGLGGYLGAKSEVESARNSRKEVERRWDVDEGSMRTSVRESLKDVGLGKVLESEVAARIVENQRRAIDFVMRTQGESDVESDGRRAYASAITIASSYFVGGLVPLLPYFLITTILRALCVSVAVMAVALFCFGYFKTRVVGERRIRRNVWGGLEMLLLGGVAAAVSVGCVKVGVLLEDAGG